MTSHARSIKHGSFVIERHLRYDTAALYRAWTNPEAKARWFNGPADKWTEQVREMDVRVGGRERVVGKFVDGSESRFEALYFDIVPERRLVYSYDMYFQGKKISVSLASVEFRCRRTSRRRSLSVSSSRMAAASSASCSPVCAPRIRARRRRRRPTPSRTSKSSGCSDRDGCWRT